MASLEPVVAATVATRATTSVASWAHPLRVGGACTALGRGADPRLLAKEVP